MFGFCSSITKYFLDEEGTEKQKPCKLYLETPREVGSGKGWRGNKSGKLEGDPGFLQSKEKGEGFFEKVEGTGECAPWVLFLILGRGRSTVKG